MNKIIKNKKTLITITTLQEAFSAIIPFFLLSSFLSLSSFLITHFHINFLFFKPEIFQSLNTIFSSFASLIVVGTIAYFSAIRLRVSSIIAANLSIAAFITIVFIESPTTTLTLPFGFSIQALFTPLLSTLFLKLFYKKFSLSIPLYDANQHIYRLFNYLFVFLFAYLATISIYYIIDYILDIIIDESADLLQTLNLPSALSLFMRDLASQLFWFSGIHGNHLVNAIFGTEFIHKSFLPNLSYNEINILFVNIGGSGAGAGLLIALLLFQKEKNLQFLTKISAPFVFFNINTLLIYAIVVFNRFLVLPFILLPLINLLLALGVLYFFPITFISEHITWTTPILINTYIKTDGNLLVVAFQAILIAFNALVYIHFLKKYLASQSIETNSMLLEKNLEIKNHIQSQEHIHSYSAHHEIIDANIKLDEIVHKLNNDNMFVYYQPKVGISRRGELKYEALIRYNNNGKLMGPIFLDTIESAGLAPIIDIWVSEQVKKDLINWKKDGFEPIISVNLHPDTLQSYDAMSKIIDIFKDENIIFEIIERSFVKGGEAQTNFQRLYDNNFPISIDDFGVGFSSFETLIKYNIDELKIDKTLIDEIQTPKGYQICKHIIQLCQETNITLIAEGVETRKQYEILRDLKIDFIQGYYFSKAIAASSVKEYAQKHS